MSNDTPTRAEAEGAHVHPTRWDEVADALRICREEWERGGMDPADADGLDRWTAHRLLASGMVADPATEDEWLRGGFAIGEDQA